MFTKQLGFFLLFVVTGVFAAVVWIQAGIELPLVRPSMSAYGCTFSCNSSAVEGFWSLVVLATFFSLCAIIFAALAYIYRTSKVEECSSC